MARMKIEWINPRRLKPWYDNPRTITPDEMQKLRRSIREHGIVENIVVQLPGNRIIGGHQRVEAAIAEGWEKVPVYRLRISDAEARFLNLRLNSISGNWDEELLRPLLREIQGEGGDLERTGLDGDRIDKLLSHALEDATIERMEVRPAPEMIYFLIGAPLKIYDRIQQPLAEIEAAAKAAHGISVQSSRDKAPEPQKKQSSHKRPPGRKPKMPPATPAAGPGAAPRPS